MILPDGGNYVGESKNGEPNGQGTMTLPDGTKYSGEWKGENLMSKEQKSPLMEVSL